MMTIMKKKRESASALCCELLIWNIKPWPVCVCVSVWVTAGSATLQTPCTFLHMSDSFPPPFKILLSHRFKGWRKQHKNTAMQNLKRKFNRTRLGSADWDLLQITDGLLKHWDQPPLCQQALLKCLLLNTEYWWKSFKTPTEQLMTHALLKDFKFSFLWLWKAKIT